MPAVTHAQILAAITALAAKVDAATVKVDTLTATVDRIEREQTIETVKLAVLLDGQARLEQGQAALAVGMGMLQGQMDEVLEKLDDPDPPPPPEGKTLWGANVGGWAQTKKEAPADAFARIQAGFGRINVVRWWANWFFDWADVPGFYGDVPLVPNLGSDINQVVVGQYDDRMRFICEQADRQTFLTFAQEPEDKGFDLGDWQAAHERLAGIKAAVGNPLVRFGPLLMGASYHATRFAGTGPNPIPASQRLDFDRTNIDFIGANCYQWGKSAMDADHAETVIGPVRDLALSYGKHVVIGELGARRRSVVSDVIRKRWIDETAAIVAANADLFLAICYYETDRGAADKVPWNLLDQDSPLAVEAYRALCTA